jgi:hypothetical protein
MARGKESGEWGIEDKERSLRENQCEKYKTEPSFLKGNLLLYHKIPCANQWQECKWKIICDTEEGKT